MDPGKAGGDSLRRSNSAVPIRLVDVCGALAAAVGMAALVGWITHIDVLATFASGRIPMAPSTAGRFAVMKRLWRRVWGVTPPRLGGVWMRSPARLWSASLPSCFKIFSA